MRTSYQKYLLLISSNIYFFLKIVLIVNTILFMPGDFEASKFHAPEKFNFEGMEIRQEERFLLYHLKNACAKWISLGVAYRFKECLHGDGLQGV